MKTRRSLIRELSQTTALYGKLLDEVQSSFRKELKDNNGKIAGLEDFYSLFMAVKKDSASVRNSLGCIKKTSDLSKYDIEESDKDLKEIFGDNK